MGQTSVRRLQLHEELCEILGSRNVYFQPPGTVRMKYPCIRYSRDRGRHLNADNRTYLYKQAYQIIYMDFNPDNEVVEQLMEHFSEISYIRNYTADNINHDVLIIYY
jgi:hypothetical protein